MYDPSDPLQQWFQRAPLPVDVVGHDVVSLGEYVAHCYHTRTHTHTSHHIYHIYQIHLHLRRNINNSMSPIQSCYRSMDTYSKHENCQKEHAFSRTQLNNCKQVAD